MRLRARLPLRRLTRDLDCVDVVYLFLAIAFLLFLACFRALNLVPVTRRIVVDAGDSLAVIRSVELSDAEKEARTQRAAITMAGSLVSVLVRSAICLVVPAAFVWLAGKAGFISPDNALAVATNWPFIITSSLVLLACWRFVR